LTQLEAVKERLKALAMADGQDTEEMNRIHAAKGLRDREMKALDYAREQIEEFSTKLATYIGHYRQQIIGFFGEEMNEGVNKVVTSEATTAVKAGIAAAEAKIRGAIEALDITNTKLEAIRSQLLQAHNTQELEFRKVIEKQQQNQAQSVERAKIEKQLNDLLFKSKRIEEIGQQIRLHQQSRDRLLATLSEHRDRRFEIRSKVAEMLNHDLSPTIRITVAQNADQEEYRKLLETHLRGASVQHSRVAQALSGSLTPEELGELIRRAEPQLLVMKGNINPDQARKIIPELASPERLMELEIVDLDDLPKIELNDNGVYKNSAGLSTGQKCTAILPILLFDSANPLLVDQPEDNLDNRYVYECVVESVKKVKTKRQLIFVTHNPNIPVLGDAELVIVMQSDGSQGGVRKSGTVDECKLEIVNLLEGGADAFRLRGERYSDNRDDT
jgi:hypothetical protein